MIPIACKMPWLRPSTMKRAKPTSIFLLPQIPCPPALLGQDISYTNCRQKLRPSKERRRERRIREGKCRSASVLLSPKKRPVEVDHRAKKDEDQTHREEVIAACQTSKKDSDFCQKERKTGPFKEKLSRLSVGLPTTQHQKEKVFHFHRA